MSPPHRRDRRCRRVEEEVRARLEMIESTGDAEITFTDWFTRAKG